MANKIINIGNANRLQNFINEVYRDISLISNQINKSEYHNSYDCNLLVADKLNTEQSILLLPDNTILATKWHKSNISLEYNSDASQSIKKSEAIFKINKLVDLLAIKNSIKQIFTWIPGERILNPEFGSMLKKYLYEPITEDNLERIVAEIKQCALRWEPRIIIDRVVRATNINDIENNTVKLDIYYRVKGLNNLQFMYLYEFSRFENI